MHEMIYKTVDFIQVSNEFFFFSKSERIKLIAQKVLLADSNTFAYKLVFSIASSAKCYP